MSKIIPPKLLIDDDESKEVFDIIISLDDSGLLKKTDAIVVALLVEALIEYKEATLNIKENGEIITIMGDRQEKQITNPSVYIKKDARTSIINLIKEIGYTPKSRASINQIVEETNALPSAFDAALKKLADKKK